ncbi:MAG: hypothetical protein U0T82_02515 [Bacteroidales bacterium]
MKSITEIPLPTFKIQGQLQGQPSGLSYTDGVAGMRRRNLPTVQLQTTANDTLAMHRQQAYSEPYRNGNDYLYQLSVLPGFPENPALISLSASSLNTSRSVRATTALSTLPSPTRWILHPHGPAISANASGSTKLLSIGRRIFASRPELDGLKGKDRSVISSPGVKQHFFAVAILL